PLSAATLFPYTTLFRSRGAGAPAAGRRPGWSRPRRSRGRPLRGREGPSLPTREPRRAGSGPSVGRLPGASLRKTERAAPPSQASPSPPVRSFPGRAGTNGPSGRRLPRRRRSRREVGGERLPPVRHDVDAHPLEPLVVEDGVRRPAGRAAGFRGGLGLQRGVEAGLV